MKKVSFFLIAAFSFTIAFSQNVGIGTTSPNYKLHVTGGDLFLESSSGRFIFGYDGEYQWRYATTNGGADLLMSTFDGTAQTYRHYFRHNGDVGLGTGLLTPAARLDVKSGSSSYSTNAFMLRNSLNDTLVKITNDGKMGIGYNKTYGRALNIQGNGINIYNEATDFTGAIFPDGNDNMVLWSGVTSDVILQPSWGKVVIGNYVGAAGYKLSVKGKLICDEARVQLSGAWPDYVFHDSYKLRPLEELEKIINTQKHLPDMPSAAEVEKDGFDLGGMNKKLLEKVEELTLYVIDLNKKYKELEQSNSKLEQQVKELKTGNQ